MFNQPRFSKTFFFEQVPLDQAKQQAVGEFIEWAHQQGQRLMGTTTLDIQPDLFVGLERLTITVHAQVLPQKS